MHYDFRASKCVGECNEVRAFETLDIRFCKSKINVFFF